LLIWNLIKRFNSIWYFDATGCVHKKINGLIILLYSLAIHDPQKKLIVPVAEFFTTSHSSSNISTFLNDIKELVHQKIGYTPIEKCQLVDHFLPRIIVTDFSWALIISAMKSFNNNRDVDEYLKYCYIILNPNEDWNENDQKVVFGNFMRFLNKARFC
jgi:hypothetical protein